MLTAVTADFGDRPSLGTQAWFNALPRAVGFYGTSINAWDSTTYWPECGKFLDMALTAGRKVFVYCRLPEGWENGLKGLGSDLAAALEFFALDVEPEAGIHPATDFQIEGLTKSNQRPVIYTNAGMWIPSMGYDPGVHFAQVPLYDRAIRPKAPTGMGQAPLVPFSGWNGKWTRRRVWQWADGVIVNGVGVTMNAIDPRWI